MYLFGHHFGQIPDPANTPRATGGFQQESAPAFRHFHLLYFLGIVLSSFYVGYMLMNIPGGYLARKCGGATMIGLSVGGTGAFTLFTPLAARIHVGLLIALRVAVGLAEVKTYYLVLNLV